MANTKITADNLAANAVTSASIADNSIGITQLNVSDGTNGQVLTTNGSGTLSFGDIPAGYTDSDVETYLNTSAIYTDATNDRLGIGTSSPSVVLDVLGGTSVSPSYNYAGRTVGNFERFGNAAISIRTDSSSTSSIDFADENDADVGRVTYDHSNNTMQFFTLSSVNTTAALTINSSSNVGIGTDSPSHLLHISSTGGASILIEADTDNVTETDNPSLHFSQDGGAVTTEIGIDNGNDMYLKANYSTGSMYFMTNSTERMRIDSSGNVGIGTATPSNYYSGADNLVVSQASGEGGITIATASDTNGALYFADGTAGGNAYRMGMVANHASDHLELYSGADKRVIIDQYGQMLITGSVSAPTAPQGHLHINQNANGNSNVNMIIDSNAPNIYFMEKNTTDKNWKLYHNAGDFAIQHVYDDKTTNFTSITFYDNGNIGAPTGSNIYNASDQRLKKNISSLTEGLSIINALNPVTFNWIDDFVKTENDKTMYGFVAQEVQDVFADAVETFVDSTIDVNGTSVETPLRVNEKFIVPVLVKALQEQQTIIDDLKSRIETLENA